MPVAPISSFPIPTTVNLDFRPDTYVADWCPLAAVMQNVPGEHRRMLAVRAWSRPARRSAMAEHLRQDVLTPVERAAFVHQDPRWRVTGEYLPPYLPGELEIARVVVSTAPQIVYSVRARADLPRGRRPHFGKASHLSFEERRALRIVDEHGTAIALEQPLWNGTCSLRELIRVIDSARACNLASSPVHLPFPEALALEGTALKVCSKRLPDYVQISSVVYPELYLFYQKRLCWWLTQHFSGVPRSARPTTSLLARTLHELWRARGE